MNLTSRTALLVTYLEAVPLIFLMALVMKFILQIEDFDIFDRIIFPLLLPPILLALLRFVEKKWIISIIAIVVASAGAISVYPHDFLRYVGLLFLLWLFFRILNEDILRLPERISKDSP